MAHLSLSPPNSADTLNPLAVAYERESKDGLIPVINFLVGSHYNARIGGETSITTLGDITADTAKAISGKLEIAADAISGEVEKIVTFTSFMYFFPAVRIVGHSEIEDDDVGSGPVPVQRMRYEFEDLATNDKILIDLEGGDGNAHLKLREVVDGIETTLVDQSLGAGQKTVFWELDFIQDGITQFHYKEASKDKLRIFNGVLGVDIGEAKASARLVLNQTSVKTVKSDFFWIFYPNIFASYDVAIVNRLKGRIRVFDTDGEPLEADWIEVHAGDHAFTGERVVENGLVRIRFKDDPAMEVFGWNGSTWISVGDVIAKNNGGSEANVLHDVIFERYNDAAVKIIAKYGIVDHTVVMRRGNPYVRVRSNSKRLKFNISRERVALSTDVNTDIPDFNQVNTDDANRGNPLNLSPTNNPFVFTDDNDIDTGLDRLDDNWISWYDDIASDTVGWAGFGARPTSMEFEAVSSTEMKRIDVGFAKNAIVGVGVLTSTPSADINGIPTPFSIQNIDEYVKWRANESVFSFEQKMFLRKKR